MLYVVAHPEATHHADGLVGGWYDSALTPAGLAAADSVGARLRAEIPVGAPVALYSSDLQRTRQTASAIGEQLNVEMVIDRDLRERSYGEAEGKPTGLDKRYAPLPPSGDRLHHHDGVPGSETTWVFAQRIYAAMDRILTNDCEHRIVVTHGGALTYVVAHWIRMPMESLGYVSFRAAPGSITVLTEDACLGNRQVVRLGDLTHLERP